MQPKAPTMTLLIRSQAFQGFTYTWLVVRRDTWMVWLVWVPFDAG